MAVEKSLEVVDINDFGKTVSEASECVMLAKERSYKIRDADASAFQRICSFQLFYDIQNRKFKRQSVKETPAAFLVDIDALETA